MKIVKTSRKDSAMKITMGPISLDIRLFFRLWLPATVFIGLCTGIFLAFDAVLLLLDQIAPSFMRNGWNVLLMWLLLLIFYIILGAAFTRFFAHLFRRSFGLEELHVQRRRAILSGLPFYVFGLFCLWVTITSILSDGSPVATYAGGIGFLAISLFSCSYLLLLRFFLRRSTSVAHQA